MFKLTHVSSIISIAFVTIAVSVIDVANILTLQDVNFTFSVKQIFVCIIAVELDALKSAAREFFLANKLTLHRVHITFSVKQVFKFTVAVELDALKSAAGEVFWIFDIDVVVVAVAVALGHLLLQGHQL